MKINFFIFIFVSLFSQSILALPIDFYKDEKNIRFVKSKFEKYYTIDKYNGDLVQIYERKSDKNDTMLGKYEAKFINPVDGDFSYNNFYQINKNYFYKDGKISSISYDIGKMDNCFIKCDEEVFYKNSKVIKKIKYPSCLSLFDVNKRILKFDDPYVKSNCIPN